MVASSLLGGDFVGGEMVVAHGGLTCICQVKKPVLCATLLTCILSSGFQTNDCLSHLNISWNGLSLLGCVALGRFLKKNEALESLDIRYCLSFTGF